MRRISIITGLSGSGKTTAKEAFEDMGFYCIDNLPVVILVDFLNLAERSGEEISKMAFVMDARGHDFIKLFPEVFTKLQKVGYQLDLLFFEASDEVLSRRFSETRRKHPLSMDSSALIGIQKERRLLKNVREKATRVVDTSDLNVHQLKDLLIKEFGKEVAFKGMNVNITSFGYRFGLPADADLVFDVRFLPNPYFRDELKNKTGDDKDVADYILETVEGLEFLTKAKDMLKFLIPLYEREGKAYLNISVGCTGGKHRSVVIANELKNYLKKIGRKVMLLNRDIDKV